MTFTGRLRLISLIGLIATLAGTTACQLNLGQEQPLNMTAEVSAENQLTAKEALTDIALAKKALMDIHPGYERYAEKERLDELWAVLEAKAAAGLSDRTLYLELSRLTTEIRCDHTKIELPKSLERTRTANPSFFPFRIMASGDQFYIYSAKEGAGLTSGDQILAIDRLKIGDISETIYSLIPVDGYTDHVKSVGLEASGDFLGSAFEHFYPLIYGEWSSVTIDILRDGKQVSVQLEPVSWDDWRALDWPGPAYRSNFVDAVQFETLEGGIGYLRIDTFVNYRRPVDPADIYAPIFEGFAAEDIQHLIIDTRFNGGGSTDAVIGLLGFLTEDRSPLFASKRVRTIDLSAYEANIDTWDPRALTPDPDEFKARADGWFNVLPETDPIALQTIPPQTPIFEGEITALTSRSNASGVTVLLSTLRDRTDAFLIGEPTGGSSEGPTAGQIFFLELPNSGIRVRIPWQLQMVNVDVYERGLGITPDRVISVKASDRLSGRDPILEAALREARLTER